MKKKKYYNKRKDSISQSSKGLFTIIAPKGSIYSRGRHLKKAMFTMMYGASDRRIQETTGLSRRRIRVLRKELLGSKKAKMSSQQVEIVPRNHHGPNVIHSVDTYQLFYGSSPKSVPLKGKGGIDE